MRIYNSLTRTIEEFQPLHAPRVGMYTCGPTVYDYVTIGNWRTYTLGDLLVRTLGFLGYEVHYVMNITDVGHLTGDTKGDADIGEDRMEKAARRERKTAWEVAELYTQDFLDGYERLGLVKPQLFSKATDHIKEQIALVQAIEARGFTYTIDDGVYFDTKKYEQAGNRYGELSTLDQIRAGARVAPNPQKRDPRDFALWKYSYKGGRSFDSAQDDAAKRRHMEWPFDFALPEPGQGFAQGKDSKFAVETYQASDGRWHIKGMGFPGWHIECSAMSMKYLGEQFDIHVGGEDLRSTHHPNEIAQSEAATGKKPFVRYWVHGAFLLVDGKRMGKSEGNAFTLHDLDEKGFEPLALRYFYLGGHYRSQLNFTWKGLEAAARALTRLREAASAFRQSDERTVLSGEKLEKVNVFRDRFRKALEEDLGLPEALAVVWEMAKSNIPGYDKYDLLVHFDQVLGLGLGEFSPVNVDIPDEIRELVQEREKLRTAQKFSEADRVRKAIEKRGFVVEDTPAGPRLKDKKRH